MTGRYIVDGMTGINDSDQRIGRDYLRETYKFRSDIEVRNWLRANLVMQHHNANAAQMELVPRALYNNSTGIPHGGGASRLRVWDYSSGTPTQQLRASQILRGGRMLGAAGMAYGAYQDGTSLAVEIGRSRQTGDYSNTAWEATRIAGGWGGAAVLGSAGAEFGAAVGWIGGPIGSAAGAVVFGAIGAELGYWGVSGAVTDVRNSVRR